MKMKKYMIVQIRKRAGGTTNIPTYDGCFNVLAKNYLTPEEAIEQKNKIYAVEGEEYIIVSYYE
jgi:hypothetical protein